MTDGPNTHDKDVKAMIMAAGRGVRMRPLTMDRPKPLIELAGRALIDHALDRLAGAGIKQVVVNVHYLADALESHLQRRLEPKITISDERGVLLDTGGGARRMLAQLGPDRFLVVNCDSVWVERAAPAIARLLAAWDGARMDALLLLADINHAPGFDGRGDFTADRQWRLARRGDDATAPYVNMGVYLIHPRGFEDTPAGAFSMNLIWDRALEKRRLFGLRHDGLWLHVGTPEALEAAHAALEANDGSAS